MDLTSYLLGKKAGGGGGVTPTGTINITSNGVTNVTNYAYADVNVGGGAEDYFVSETNQSNAMAIIKRIPPITLTYSGDFESAFNGGSNLEQVDELSIPNATSIKSMFQSCGKLKNANIKTSSALINVNALFRYCSALESFPGFNTTNVTNFTGMCMGCSSLKDFPQLDFSSATEFTNMFFSVSTLTDESINNILASCVSATSYTGTKTLSTLGLSSSKYPASTIQGLSNYQAFLDAGWTIGYN